MKEVEVKIIEIDRVKVESKLNSLGATRTFDGDEETVFFDYPDGSIMNAKNLLRLRKIGNKTVLTFKKFVEGGAAKVRDEYEVSVSDFAQAHRILESLGLSPIQRMEKHRTSYVLKNGVIVEIDKYTGKYFHIPEFMEVEGEDEATIHRQAKLLGFKPEECKSWTTFDLIDYYASKHVKV